MGSSEANIKHLSNLLNAQTIGPNKIEQYRHVKFLTSYPGGIDGLMRDHARIIAPKFEAVYEVLEHHLSGTNLATWTQPKGGYFISLNTHLPIADKVVRLANEAGVSLTPAGATYPRGKDPHNSNIRLAPTRPPVEEVRLAMEVVATCIKLASLEVSD
jgi:DNA-binding transcriptional MocR family regulator